MPKRRRYVVRVPCKGASFYYVEAETAKEAERLVLELDPSDPRLESDAPWINECGKPRARLDQ